MPVKPIRVIYSYRCFLLVALIMASSLFRVWKKDELSAVQREMISLSAEIKKLDEERKKLRVDIAMEKNSGRIQKKSLSIGLIAPHSRQIVSTWKH